MLGRFGRSGGGPVPGANKVKYIAEKVDGVFILEVTGNLDGGAETLTIKDAIKAELNGGGRRILVDMHQVEFVNSTAIGMLVSIQVACATVEAELKFCRMQRRVQRSLQATGACILESMSLYDTRAVALEAFAGRP